MVIWFACLTSLLVESAPQQHVLVVRGATGDEEYQEPFDRWAQNWQQTAQKAGAEFTLIGQIQDQGVTDKERLARFLADLPEDNAEPLWMVLIGHGTFDGRAAKFNLQGPDITAQELAEYLRPVKRPVAVISCFSASSPFLKRVSHQNRITISATRSGFQYNYSRFGGFISEAISDPAADLDKDQQVSLLEAFLSASARVAEFYEQESRLATEHSLLDDNGDQLGTPADWFRGVRTTRTAKEGAQPDGLRANQLSLLRSDAENQLPTEARQKRDALELELADLRIRKKAMTETQYYQRLETVLLELAQLYEQHQG